MILTVVHWWGDGDVVVFLSLAIINMPFYSSLILVIVKWHWRGFLLANTLTGRWSEGSSSYYVQDWPSEWAVSGLYPFLITPWTCMLALCAWYWIIFLFYQCVCFNQLYPYGYYYCSVMMYSIILVSTWALQWKKYTISARELKGGHFNQ